MRGSVAILIGICACLIGGCSTSQNNMQSNVSKNKVTAGTPAPGWVWVPEYYVYNGKNYRFVKGHYRKVLSRRAYWRRSLRGYSQGKDHTAAR